MIRRTPLLLLAVLTGCSTFSSAGEVANVDGTSISNDLFEAVTDDYFGHPEVFSAPVPTADGRLDGDTARVLVAALARATVYRNLVDDAAALEAARQPFYESLKGNVANDSFFELGPELQTLFADLQPSVQAEALGAAGNVPADVLEEQYNRRPADTGLMCVRNIVVDTRAEADEIVALLADGGDFATLAVERSVDPSAAVNGGALEGSFGACLALAEARQGLVPEFVVAATEAVPGRPTEPFQSDYGWHIVAARPWSEVADSVLASYESDGAGRVVDAAISRAEVTVASRYGVWDPATATVTALG